MHILRDKRGTFMQDVIAGLSLLIVILSVAAAQGALFLN